MNVVLLQESMFFCNCLIEKVFRLNSIFSTFGFASLFSVLPRYGIYQSKCKIISEKIISNDTTTIRTDCSGQIEEYQVRLKLNEKFFKR